MIMRLMHKSTHGVAPVVEISADLATLHLSFNNKLTHNWIKLYLNYMFNP